MPFALIPILQAVGAVFVWIVANFTGLVATLTFIVASILATSGWLDQFFPGLGLFVQGLFIPLAWLLSDLAVYIFAGLLNLVSATVGKLDSLPGADLIGMYWSAIPDEYKELTIRLRVLEALGLILAAIVVRFTLQLIPFTRLGS